MSTLQKKRHAQGRWNRKPFLDEYAKRLAMPKAGPSRTERRALELLRGVVFGEGQAKADAEEMAREWLGGAEVQG